MKLIRLSSSIDTFKTVYFNPDGFTIILAEKEEDLSKTKSSFNGVGKSLIIFLIHFCLGCQNNDDLKNKFSGKYFELEFEISGEVFIARRYTSEQENIYLNGEKLKLTSFADTLQEKVFPNSSFSFITFKHLISRFIRPFTYSYGSWNKWLPKEYTYTQEFVPNLNTLYLFGFDPEIILRKYELYENLKEYKYKLDSFKKDPILSEYFKDTKRDLDIDIESLKKNISLKEEKLSSLTFSEDYYEIESKAGELAINLGKNNNKRILLENALNNINESLKNDFGRNNEFVSSLYDTLKNSMKDNSMRELKDVLEFHNSLLANRQKRLREQRKIIMIKIENLNSEILKLTKEHNYYLKCLDQNAPFEQALAIKDEINIMTQKLMRLQEYDQIVEKYTSQITNTNTELINNGLSAENYLKEIKELRINIDGIFKELVDTFYQNKESYISIKNNIGNNTIRFDLNVKLEDDSSNGVREIEIFCFDLALFILRKNTLVDFIFHDSRLFANVDPSQMVIAFQILNNLIKHTSMQYIISLNDNQYNEIKEQFRSLNTLDEFDEIFNEETIKLRLTREDKGKLLGIQVDINYDKT